MDFKPFCVEGVFGMGSSGRVGLSVGWVGLVRLGGPGALEGVLGRCGWVVEAEISRLADGEPYWRLMLTGQCFIPDAEDSFQAELREAECLVATLGYFFQFNGQQKESEKQFCRIIQILLVP